MKAFRLPLLLVGLAAVCGFLRWTETYAVIRGDAVRFVHLNDTVWDDFRERVSRTGNDPYLVFDLPAYAQPIRHVTFSFDGDYIPTEGSFYLFPSTGSEMGPMITPNVTRATDSIRVSGTLPDSTGIRLDLPDFLPRSLQIKRIDIRRPFFDWHAWSLRLALLGAVGALVSVLLARRRRSLGSAA